MGTEITNHKLEANSGCTLNQEGPQESAFLSLEVTVGQWEGDGVIRPLFTLLRSLTPFHKPVTASPQHR